MLPTPRWFENCLVRSRTKGGHWRTIEGQANKLRCPTIRKQSFRNSGSGDVADPRYQGPNHLMPRRLLDSFEGVRLFLPLRELHSRSPPSQNHFRPAVNARCPKPVAHLAIVMRAKLRTGARNSSTGNNRQQQSERGTRAQFHCFFMFSEHRELFQRVNRGGSHG